MAVLRMTALAALLAVAAEAAKTQSVELKEYLGRTWTNELISYPLDKPLARAATVQVMDETGTGIPAQVLKGRVYLLVTLAPNATRKFTFAVADTAALPPKPVEMRRGGGAIEFDSGVMAVRLLDVKKDYATPVAAAEVPGPLLGTRLSGGGPWIGESWLDVALNVTGCKTTVSASGPLFAEATVAYSFEGDRNYSFTVRVIAGQSVAMIDERMDLNPGSPFSDLPYSNDAAACFWDWSPPADSAVRRLVPAGGDPSANVVFAFGEPRDPKVRLCTMQPQNLRAAAVSGQDSRRWFLALEPAAARPPGDLEAPVSCRNVLTYSGCRLDELKNAADNLEPAPIEAAGATVTTYSTLPPADFLLTVTAVNALPQLTYCEPPGMATVPVGSAPAKPQQVPPFVWQRRVFFVRPLAAADTTYMLVRDDFAGAPLKAKPVLALLYPRKAGEPAPEFSRIADGNGVKLAISATMTDYTFLAPTTVTYTDDKVRFAALAGQIQLAEGILRMVLPQGGTVTAGGLTLTSTGPASLVALGGQMQLATTGTVQKLSLSGAALQKVKISAHGKASRLSLNKGMLEMTDLTGDQTLTISGQWLRD